MHCFIFERKKERKKEKKINSVGIDKQESGVVKKSHHYLLLVIALTRHHMEVVCMLVANAHYSR
jgi:5'-3' exonuclease